MSDILISNASQKDFDSIRVLCDERYGEGYFSQETYDHYSQHPDLFITAHIGDELAGFAVMVPTSNEEIAKEMKMPQKDVDDLAGDKPPIIYKSLVIQQKFEKMGLPLAMSNVLLERAKQAGYGTLFASA